MNPLVIATAGPVVAAIFGLAAFTGRRIIMKTDAQLEKMAASMEQQLMVAFKKIYELTAPAGNPLQLQPNYRYYPEIVVSEELNAVLSETSWLASADGIADAMDGDVLASLCSPTRQ